MGNQELYSEYEKVYVGIKKNLTGSFFKDNDENARTNAILLMRYAFEKFLRWTPEDISHSVNEDILKKMHLFVLLKYLKLPEELGTKIDPKYFAHILYPEKIYYNDANIALEVYKKILSEEFYGYPKKFFHDEKGVQRAKICLSYVLREKLIFSNINEVYEFFTTSAGRKAIQQYHLTSAFSLFETPIDYVHQVLSPSQKNDFLYHFYKFKCLYRKEKTDVMEMDDNEKSSE